MLKRFVGLIDLEQYIARNKIPYEHGKLSASHIFDYIVLKVNPSLTSCEHLATSQDNSLDND